MKKSIIYLLSLSLILGFIGCGGDSSDDGDKKDKTHKERLDGKWEIIKAEGILAEINMGTQFIFEGTTRFTTKKGIIENSGDIIEITDDFFKVKFDNLESDFEYKYKFEGDKLVIEVGTEGQLFTLERK